MRYDYYLPQFSATDGSWSGALAEVSTGTDSENDRFRMKSS
ncbi:hypothetical protein GMO_16290 [Gluconobacter morbifer G707]|uniref:Uncharacterized protein n=1 Tax=Gluconobacter morbifer G707 TaxID=1088869 RepID=G6XJQ0_9PROT|nr:hypothetical protein GMO_16290 [Gluconobacter morbifer G707]